MSKWNDGGMVDRPDEPVVILTKGCEYIIPTETARKFLAETLDSMNAKMLD